MEHNRLKITKSFNKVFFTADLHLNHARLLEKASCRRGTYLECMGNENIVQSMNRTILEQWEQTVSTSSTVFCLGDIAFSFKDGVQEKLAQLPGDKYLIRGNHDSRLPSTWVAGWDGFLNLSVTDPDDGNVIHATVGHYPMLSWKDSHYGTWCLHGHHHGADFRKVPNSFDVGVDTAILNGIPRPLPFAPYSLTELLSYLGNPKYWEGPRKAEGHHHDLENGLCL